MENITNLFFVFSNDVQLMKYISHSYDTYEEELEDYSESLNLLRLIPNATEISAVRIYLEDRKIYTQADSGFYSPESVKHEDWYRQQALEMNESIHVYLGPPASNGKPALYFAKNIRSNSIGAPFVGTMVFEIRMELLERQLSSFAGSVFLTDTRFQPLDGSALPTEGVMTKSAVLDGTPLSLTVVAAEKQVYAQVYKSIEYFILIFAVAFSWR